MFNNLCNEKTLNEQSRFLNCKLFYFEWPVFNCALNIERRVQWLIEILKMRWSFLYSILWFSYSPRPFPYHPFLCLILYESLYTHSHFAFASITNKINSFIICVLILTKQLYFSLQVHCVVWRSLRSLRSWPVLSALFIAKQLCRR